MMKLHDNLQNMKTIQPFHITERGQVSIPAKFRRGQFQFLPGRKVKWEPQDNGALLVRVLNPKPKGIRAAVGLLNRDEMEKTKTTAEWMKIIYEGEEDVRH